MDHAWIMQFLYSPPKLGAESSTWSPIQLLPQEEASELRSAKYGEAACELRDRRGMLVVGRLGIR